MGINVQNVLNVTVSRPQLPSWGFANLLANNCTQCSLIDGPPQAAVPQLGSWGLLAAPPLEVTISKYLTPSGRWFPTSCASNLIFYARLFEPLAHSLASSLSSGNEGETKNVVRAFGQGEESLYACWVAVGG